MQHRCIIKPHKRNKRKSFFLLTFLLKFSNPFSENSWEQYHPYTTVSLPFLHMGHERPQHSCQESEESMDGSKTKSPTKGKNLKKKKKKDRKNYLLRINILTHAASLRFSLSSYRQSPIFPISSKKFLKDTISI